MAVQLIGLQIEKTMWEYRVKDSDSPVPFLVYSSEYPTANGRDAVVRWNWWLDHTIHGPAEHMTREAAVKALQDYVDKGVIR